ncbi:glucokinase [Maritalea myrionectae]|uniref:Glucokinase n=1 Tax=Maritalea myrionectae TaxID=454601 RepID=A0A2R4MGC2_9HYPH|nr:ROK family protein [Maritalea myrionectae]AVX04934.1 glucokinase [Maritalea myrionectae]
MAKALNGFAIDLGGTKLAAARFEANKLVEKAQMPTKADAPFEDLCAAMAMLLDQLGFCQGNRLGVALTGRIDQSGHWSAVNGGTLPKIKDIDVRNAFTNMFGTNLTILNDATAAACGEAHFGAGQGVSAFGYITISTGVGGGIVLNGQPVTSPNGLAGHIGFMRSPLGNAECGCGRFGTVESVAGGRAMAHQAHVAGFENLNAKMIFEAYLANEKWATEIISRAAQAIAIQIADLTSIFGLERVAIGGSIGLADGFLELISLSLSKEPDLFQPDVRCAALGSNSPLFGALCI